MEGQATRVCVVCGASLASMRRDAQCCSPRCRREKSRFEAILSGEGDSGYRSIRERLDAADRGVCTLLWASQRDGGHLHDPGSLS